MYMYVYKLIYIYFYKRVFCPMMFGHGLVRKMKTAEFCFRPAKDSLVKINVSSWSHRVEQIRIYTHNKYLQS